MKHSKHSDGIHRAPIYFDGLSGYYSTTFNALEKPKLFTRHTSWLHNLKKQLPNINEFWTDKELIDDMYKLNWSIMDVLTYWEKEYGSNTI